MLHLATVVLVEKVLLSDENIDIKINLFSTCTYGIHINDTVLCLFSHNIATLLERAEQVFRVLLNSREELTGLKTSPSTENTQKVQEKLSDNQKYAATSS